MSLWKQTSGLNKPKLLASVVRLEKVDSNPMRLKISHRTAYRYDEMVQLNQHLLYLRPRDNPLLTVHRFELNLSPHGNVSWMRDDFDNLPASVSFYLQARELIIDTECEVTTDDAQPFDFALRQYALPFPFSYEPLHRFNLGLYLLAPDAATQAGIRQWLLDAFPAPPAQTVAWLLELAQKISNNFSYQRREEEGIQAPKATIAMGSGSCRDFAALFVACARTMGVAARFVSGYLYDPNAVVGTGEMHAWVEVFLPGAGWRALDPTLGVFCHNLHVPVAHAVVAESINPIQGSFEGAGTTQATLSTQVSIEKA